jgi:uncharacterized SAM-binding protein YcdF (DUF218 family)
MIGQLLRSSSSTVDLLIVLGKNIGIGSTAADIKRSKWHLSVESRLNVLAAGALYQSGMHILFSGGKTVGNNVPSEAKAMYDYFRHHFPEVPDSDLFLEEQSIDTASNAERVQGIIHNAGYMHISLLTVGYHVANAATLFRRYGVAVEIALASEEIMKNRSIYYQKYITNWSNLKRIKYEIKKEWVRKVLLHTIDPRGKLLRQVAKISRNKYR